MLNATFYVFAYFDRRFSVYPADSSRHVFRQALKLSGEDVQIVTHRDGALLYYMYIRRLSSGKDFWGLSILLNDQAVCDHRALFKVFDRTFADTILQDGLVTMNEKGEFLRRVKAFRDEKEAKAGVSELQVQFSLADLSSRALPPVSNAIGCNELAVCAISDSTEESFNKITSYAFAGVVRDKRSVLPIDKISQMLQTYVREQKQMEETLRKDRRRFRMLKVRYVVETIFYIILGLMALGIVVELVILCSRWF